MNAALLTTQRARHLLARSAGRTDEPVVGTGRGAFNPAADRAFDELLCDIAPCAQVRAGSSRSAGDDPDLTALAAPSTWPSVAGTAKRALFVNLSGRAYGTAGYARVAWCFVAGLAERSAVRAPSGWHSCATAACALLDHFGIDAIARMANTAVLAARDDTGDSAAATAGLLAAAGVACVTYPPVGPHAWQVDVAAAALRTGRSSDGLVARGAQSVGETDNDDRAVWIPGEERVRMGGQVLIEVAQRNTVIGPGRGQQSCDVLASGAWEG